MIFKIKERGKRYVYSTNDWCLYYDEDYHNYYLEFNKLMHKEHRPSFFILTKAQYDYIADNLDIDIIDIDLDKLDV